MRDQPPLGHRGARRPCLRAVAIITRLCGCAALLASLAPAFGAEAPEKDAPSFRIGFSSAMFTEINENDAKAALKVWAQTIVKDRGLQVDPDTKIFKDTPALVQALRSDLVDALGITTVEYAALRQEEPFNPICVACAAGTTTVQYLLLAHRDSKIEDLADLRGRSLVFYQNGRACMAPQWLDTLLLEKGLPPAKSLAARVTQNLKLSQVVLPVFFRQNDACVVTRKGFETMCELNPQVGRQIKVLATSQEVIPAVLCFRAAYSSALKDQLVASVVAFHETPAGRQVLTVFQSDRFEKQPTSCLDSALELLAHYDRLCSPTNAIALRRPGSEPPQPGGSQ